MAVSRSVLAKYSIEPLASPQIRELARSALGLPNEQGRATGNRVEVATPKDNLTWGKLANAGLARCRRVSAKQQEILGEDDINGDFLYLLFENGENVEYELTQPCIDAVLEKGEDRGDATVSEDADLYPAMVNFDLSYEDILKVAEDCQHEPRVPNSDAEWELEQSVFALANDQTLPVWARKLIGGLWREVCHREEWYEELRKHEAAARKTDQDQEDAARAEADIQGNHHG